MKACCCLFCTNAALVVVCPLAVDMVDWWKLQEATARPRLPISVSCLQAAGDADWWKLREATLQAVGGTADALLELLSQSEHSSLSFEWLLDNVLHNDMTGQNNSPFLVGKGLWVAAR